MNVPGLRVLTSVDELRAFAAAWDDLWRRSETHFPTSQAKLLELWLQTFAPRARLHVLVVEHDGMTVAALPLVLRRKQRLVLTATLPTGEWSPAGDLLLDPGCDVPAVLDVLVDGLCRSGCSLVELAAIELEAPRWQAFRAALGRRGVHVAATCRVEVGRVDVSDGWDAYLATRTRNHRRHMRTADAKAQKAGETRLVVLDWLASGDVESWLARGFAAEDESWKGRDGTSVLRAPGIFDFYCKQARLLAEHGQLFLALLEHAGQTIGFEYGWLCKGVYSCIKCGFDERFAKLTPGQLLRWHLLEQLHGRPDCRLVDFTGPLSDATAKWTTSTYRVSKLLAAIGPLGRAALGMQRLKWRARGVPA